MIIRADARQLPLRDGCVQCVVTSPPYFGLRDYGSTHQIGLEATPDAYVQTLVEVFRDVRRVLAKDGTVWLNLGDSYAAAFSGNHGYKDGRANRAFRLGPGVPEASKPKDLLGVPWAVAFALRDDGWYLRSDIIWAKPNPMPESVTDRPTKSHEYLFLLTKSERYQYDASAIAEPVSAAMLQEVEQGYEGLGLKDYEGAGVQNPSSVKARIIANARRKNEQSGDRRKVGFNDRWDAKERTKAAMTPRNDGDRWQCSGKSGPGGGPGVAPRGMGRNRRTVWTIPTMPFTGWERTSRRVRVSWDESDDDTTRTTSPDCPVHGDRAVQAAKVLCGERVADSSSHSGRSDDGPALAPLLDSVPTGRRRADCSEVESRDSSDPSHEALATPRNTRSRKTARALLTTSPCSVSAETRDGTGDTSAPLLMADLVERRPENSTAADCVSGVPVTMPDGTPIRIGDKCSCEYYRTITENTSHFATMPEALVEPCILAGCPLGGLVLDPFLGSGTVGAVAERLGRRWVGTDLSYQALAVKRTAQRGIRFDEGVA